MQHQLVIEQVFLLKSHC